MIVTFASARHSLDVRFLDRSAKVTHSGGRLGSRYPIGRRDRPRSRCRQEKRKRETVIRNSTRTTFTITISDRVCRLRRNENRNLGVLVCITRRIVPLLTICAICVRASSYNESKRCARFPQNRRATARTKSLSPRRTGVRLSVPKDDGCIHRCVYACGGASSRRVCVYVRGCGSSGLCQRVLTLTQGALLLRCAFLPFLFC